MSHPIELKPFEKRAIILLCNDILEPGLLSTVLSSGNIENYEYTGSGYYLTISHPDLPNGKRTFSEPTVMGNFGDITSGFVAYMENNQIVLECHTWGSVDIPEDFRDKNVNVYTREIDKYAT